MTDQEFLASDVVRRGLQKARTALRMGGGSGKIMIVLDYHEDAFRSGRIETQTSSARIDAKHYVPE